MALLPRLKAGVVAVGAAALLATGPAAFAADLVVGEEVFNNNCGEQMRKVRGGWRECSCLQLVRFTWYQRTEIVGTESVGPGRARGG